jgi:hypothetical protein
MASWGSVPFGEQIKFFFQRKLVPTERWNDLWKDAHDAGFMVAGATKADLLGDLQNAVGRAIAEGTTLEQFRKDFELIVQRHGWTGWTGEGTEAGRAWRTHVIYDTNLRQSYHAGRWAQMWDARDRRPFFVYRHNDGVTHPRPLHLSWDGIVVPLDSDWARTHHPQNGWGCQCWSYTINRRQLEKMGKSGPDTPPDDGTYEWTDKRTGEVHRVPKGIDPGFDYPPGGSRAEQIRRQVERKAAGPNLDEIIARKLLDLSRNIPKVPPAPIVAATEPVAVGRLGPGGDGAYKIPARPVADALDIPTRGALARDIKEVLALIDQVHGDGKLPKIPVRLDSATRRNGAYISWQDGRAEAIALSRKGTRPRLTIAHEIGHFLDHQALGFAGRFDHTGEFWADWKEAVKGSEAVRELQNLPSNRHRSYLLEWRELWARSYSQYIAAKSGDSGMLEAIGKIRENGIGGDRFSQWSEEDFKPIAAAIEAMFTKLGWMR